MTWKASMKTISYTHLDVYKRHVLSIAAFIAVPSYGVFAFLLVTWINMGTYLKDKEVIQVYLTGFKCMLQLINCAGALDKLKIEELHRYTERLNACEKGFSGFRNSCV